MTKGFTGKCRFAIVQQIIFSCEGMNPQNPNSDLYKDHSIMRTSFVENIQMQNSYNIGSDYMQL